MERYSSKWKILKLPTHAGKKVSKHLNVERIFAATHLDIYARN